METAVKSIVSFDKFTVDPLRRVLLERDRIVNLNPKTFDLLLALIERHGEVVSKTELLDVVWVDQFVEENNLTVHIAALRKVFGEKKNDHRFIVTVPGNGYRFVAELNAEAGNEITIESHKFERVVIEEEIEDEAKENREILQTHKLNESQKSKTASRWPLQILLLTLGVSLIPAIFGFWYLRSRIAPENKKLQFAKLTASGKVSHATITPDGKYVVFSQLETGGESLWLKHVATASQTQILPNKPVKFVGLNISPESDLIYATVFSGDMPDPQIWRVPLLGGAVEEIKEIKTGAAVSLSPDGKRFAFTESRSGLKETHFGIAEANGSNKKILIRAADERRSFPNFNASPVAWSPAGDEIAVAVREKTGDGGGEKALILLVNPDTGSERRITEKNWDYVENLAWIDAENLAFIAFTLNPWQGQVWAVSRQTGEVRSITADLHSYTWLAGSADKKLLTVQKTAISHLRVADFDEQARLLQTREIFGESGFIENVAWTPDGRILYSSSASGRREIWRVNPDGSSPTQLTVNAEITFGLSVSPADGSLVFGSTDQNGKHFLQSTDSEGKNMRRITDGDEDVFPNFTAGGGSIIFQRGLNNKLLTLRRVDLTGGASTQLTQSQAAHPAVSSDGAQTAYYFMDRESDNLWRIGLIDSATGEFIRKLDLPPNATERRMRWHPSGRFLTQIFYSGENANLLLLTADGRERREIAGFGKGGVNWFEWSPDGTKIVAAQTETMQDAVLISEY